jgi:hypothetical protein
MTTTTIDLANDIANTDPTEAQITLADALLNGSTTTTAALLAMHSALVTLGDRKAARIIDSIIDRMAQHEAETM